MQRYHATIKFWWNKKTLERNFVLELDEKEISKATKVYRIGQEIE